jgi:carotenoid cleavage dioxygenase-like enzyme
MGYASIIVLGALAHAHPKRDMLDYSLFWTSDYRETDEIEVPVEGVVPEWADGTLYRNGPGRFEVGERRVTHQFDGLAKIYKFRLSGGKVYYATKFLKSHAYNESLKQNDIVSMLPTYPLIPPVPLPERLRRVMTVPSDNGLINVFKTGEYIYATQDTPLTSMFDPVTLDYRGYGPPIKGLDYTKLTHSSAPAHPVRTFTGEKTVNLLYDNFASVHGLSTKVTVVEDSPDMTRRVVGSAVVAPFVTTTHSFPMTENYVIVIAMPFVIHTQDILTGKAESGIQAAEFKTDIKSKVFVFDLRKTEADPVREFDIDPFYYNHQINAFEESGKIHIDLLAFPNGDFLTQKVPFGNVDLMRDLHRVEEYMSSDGGASKVRATPTRLTIDLSANSIEVSQMKIADEEGNPAACEMPRINDDFAMKPYCIFYAGCQVTRGGERGLYSEVMKLNICTGKAEPAPRMESVYVDEAIFVPDRSGGEDGGLLAVPALDGEAGKTVLLMLDGKSLEVVARAQAPFHHPNGVHGRFFSSRSDSAVLV